MTHNTEYQRYVDAPAPPAAGVPDSALTPPDILGPFYRPGALFVRDIVPLRYDEEPRITLSGVVQYEDGSPANDNVYIEFWQADPDGKYDEAGQSYRGIQAVGADGSYRLVTVRPGDYDISGPDDPQPHDYRCSHIHVKVWVNGRDVLTTQLYFADDKYNETDHWFDPRRVIKFDANDGKFDFVIRKGP